MVCLGEHEYKHLNRHIVAAVLVCACLPVATIETDAMVMVVAKQKEAAP